MNELMGPDITLIEKTTMTVKITVIGRYVRVIHLVQPLETLVQLIQFMAKRGGIVRHSSYISSISSLKNSLKTVSMKLTHAENSMPKVAHAYSIPTCMYSWIKFLNNCYNNKTEVQKPEQGNAYEGE